MTRKHNILTWIIYSIFCYVILIPFQMWITGISIALLLGFFFGLLNNIVTQLRILNNEISSDELPSDDDIKTMNHE